MTNPEAKCANCGHARRDHLDANKPMPAICTAKVKTVRVNAGMTVTGLCECNGFKEED